MNRQRWKNDILNVQADPEANVDSDHFPVWAVYRTRLKKIKSRVEVRCRYEDPTSEQQRRHNEEVRRALGNTDGETDGSERWAGALRVAAQLTLQRTTKRTTGPRIRESTWRLIRERDKLLKEHTDAEIKDVTNRIRK